MNIPLGICTRYDRLGASSRCRYYQYEDAFRKEGFLPEFHPFFPNRYLEKLYAGNGRSHRSALAACFRRFQDSFRFPERLLIEYELLPGLPAAVELVLIGKRRFVLNYDDDVWVRYAGKPFLENKYDTLIRHAAGVVTANTLLEKRAQALCPNVIKVPTAVDLDDYTPEKFPKFPRFTVVWIGTPVTYAYLEQAAEALRSMAQHTDFELLVIARRSLEARAIPGVPMRFEEWSPENEAELLCRSHVGIMPLPAEDPFARGKSAFKLIQYMAAGIPAIASGVGENRRVLLHGETGFLADTPAEWNAALLCLAGDDGCRNRMAAAARRRAFEYSTQKYAPILTGFLRRTLL